ncbi:MAG: SpoIIE family protein phosphatase [Clostridia bacterium]|nr:SpoIIE family protein phosphatase [Clostridia bacterium]
MRYRGDMKVNTALKYVKSYVLVALLTVLCQRAQIVGDYRGYALPLLVALFYCRFSVGVICPCYLAICLIFDHSLFGIFYAVAPVIILLVAKYLHYLFARPMRLRALICYCVLCLLPLAVLDFKVTATVDFIVYLVSQVVVSMLFCVICYAVCVRGIGRKLSVDERVGGFVFLAVIASGVYSLDIYGFNIYYLALGLAIPYLFRNFSFSQGAVIIGAIALGGCLPSINLALTGAVMLIFFAAYVFVVNKWVASSAAVMMHIICGIYFNAFKGVYWLNLIGFAVGILIMTALTDKVMAKLPSFKFGDGRESARELVNRTRRDLASRLSTVSGVFGEMSQVYSQNVVRYAPPMQAAPALAEEVMLKTCGNCINREYCQGMMGMELSQALEGVVRTVLTSGKVTIEDLPTVISSKCIQLPSLLATCNQTALSYDVRYNSGRELEVDQNLISSQLMGVCEFLSELGEEVKSAVNIDDKLDERIVEELGYNNIVCSDVMSIVKNGKHTISLIVRERDREKKALLQVLSKLTNTQMQLKEEKKTIDGRYCMTFVNTPKYNVTYATATCTKPDSPASGDTYIVTKLKHDKVLIALCDGMGSGVDAREGSQRALNMVSSYYRAGFDNVNSLKLVNRLLSVISKDNFNALDMCVVDLELGTADFIKQGGVQSVIKRLDSVQIIDSKALPLGIVEEATPQVNRQLLSVGEMVVMFSDGIMDTLTLAGIKHIVTTLATLNPQQICDEIINQAKAMGLKDDSSVVVFRLSTQ